MKIVSFEFKISDDQCGSRSASKFLKQNIIILINFQRSWILIQIHIFEISWTWIWIQIRKKNYGSATLPRALVCSSVFVFVPFLPSIWIKRTMSKRDDNFFWLQICFKPYKMHFGQQKISSLFDIVPFIQIVSRKGTNTRTEEHTSALSRVADSQFFCGSGSRSS